MAAGDLTTLTNVRAWLGITSVNDDAILSRLITSASAYIQSWINRSFALQTYSESRSGNGGAVMAFADYPVTAVSSVVIDGQTIPQSPDGQQAGYVFDANTIGLIGYRFNKGFNNVQLVYTAGYANVPFEIEQACIELLSLRYRERERIGHQSKSVQGETVSYIVKDMPDSVKTILNNYRKVIPL